MHWQVSLLQYYWGLIPIPSLCMCVHEWKTWTQVQFVQEHDSRFIFYIVCIYIIWMCCCAHVWMILYALCIYVWIYYMCILYTVCTYTFSVCVCVYILCMSACACKCFISVCQWTSTVHSRAICCELWLNLCCPFSHSLSLTCIHKYTHTTYACTVMMHLGSTEAAR